MPHALAYQIADAPTATDTRRAHAPANILLASLAGAFVTTCLSGASLVYAFTHIPEVDPNAEAAPLAAVAAVAAEKADVSAKLAVLTPPVYGPGVLSEAPDISLSPAPFVPLKAQVPVDQVDMNALAQADGSPPPCADPCTAQAGYIAPDGTAATAMATPAAADGADMDRSPDRRADSIDDDGNAPPPPDMVVN